MDLPKPDTVGGAMKMLARQWGTFTGAELKATIVADADWRKALEKSPSGITNNLKYWSDTGKLNTQDGETYTVANAEFFKS